MTHLSKPRVSVITIVFNGEKFIEGAMRSIARQTFTDYEHIIVDDGSQDDTPWILSEWAKKDTRVQICRQPNYGIPKAYNLGVKAAQGDYIAILDADDLALPTRLEKQILFLDKHEEVGLLGCAELAMEMSTRRVWVVKHPEYDPVIRRSWVHHQVFTHSATMVRRHIFEQVGYYDENLPIGCDPDLWLRIAEKWKVANLSEPLILRRHHSGQISRTNRFKTVALNVNMKWDSIRRLGLPVYFRLYIIFPLMGVIPNSLKRFVRQRIGHEKVISASESSTLLNGLKDLV